MSETRAERRVMAHWPLWRRNTALAAAGRFSTEDGGVGDPRRTSGRTEDGGVGDPRRTVAGSETRAERRRDLGAMFLNLKMKRAWRDWPSILTGTGLWRILPADCPVTCMSCA